MTLPFVDEAMIHVTAGNGGDGVATFRREAHVALGGPDGGDGGHGGNVIIRADHNVSSLARFRSQRQFTAEHGANGQGRQCTGASADHLIIPVPVGTILRNKAGEQIADLSEHDQSYIAVYGGKGGLGNQHFKSSTNRSPRKCTLGKPGEELAIWLELSLVGDIGLVGFPNAGKSTFLAAVTNAKPKIADYPFTTLSPNQGICDLDIERSLLIADIPGLLEGAAEGVGLGHQFLRHIRRTSVLLFLVDCLQPTESIVQQYTTLCNELVSFDENLMLKPRVFALSKTDGLPANETTEVLQEVTSLLEEVEFKPGTTLAISSVTHFQLKKLLETLWQEHAAKRTQEKKPELITTWTPLDTN